MKKSKKHMTKPFPAEAIAQAHKISFSEETFEKRTLVRGMAIDDKDPQTGHVTPDRDDAIWVRRADNGDYLLDITITDISSWIPMDSPIAEEALKRGFTEYRNGAPLNPMIPAGLSEGLFSLNEGEKRPTITATIRMNKDLNLSSASCSLYKSYVETVESLYHDHVTKENITGNGYDLKEWHMIAKRLFEQRSDGDKEIWNKEDLNAYLGKTEKATHFIVQEFMILGNTQVAKFADDNNIPVIFRNHALIQDNKRTLNRIARDTSQILNRKIRTKDIKPLVKNWEDRGHYSPYLKAHHALKIKSYMHFTSPLRRYPDLHSHYNLVCFLDNKELLYSDHDLKRIADHANRRKLEVERPSLSKWPYRLPPENMKYVLTHLHKGFKRASIKKNDMPKRSNKELYNILFHAEHLSPATWQQWKDITLQHLRKHPERAEKLIAHMKSKNPAWDIKEMHKKEGDKYFSQIILETPKNRFSAPIITGMDDEDNARTAAHYLFLEAYLEKILVRPRYALKADYLESKRHIYGLHYHKPEYYLSKIKKFIPDAHFTYKEVNTHGVRAWRANIKFNTVTEKQGSPARRMHITSDGKTRRDAMTSALTKLFRNHYFQLTYNNYRLTQEKNPPQNIEDLAKRLKLNPDLFNAPHVFYEDPNFKDIEKANMPIRYITPTIRKKQNG